MTLNNFHYALTLANQLYGIEMQDNDFEEVALIGFGKIGNKRCRLFKLVTETDELDQVELPCNCIEVEAVTTGMEDWQYVSNILPNGDIYSAFTENYIEGRKLFKDKLYINGKYVKYEQVGNTLYFSNHYKPLNILYYGEIVYDTGLPQITDEEALALANYIAYTQKFKDGYQTNNPQTIQFATTLQQRWLVSCDQARVAKYPSQNDLNEILDAKTNWNRKMFGKSYKPVK